MADTHTFNIQSGTELGTTGAVIASKVGGQIVRVYDVHAVAVATNTNLYLRSESLTGPRYIKVEVTGGEASEVFSEGIVFPNGVYAETGATFQFASITCKTEL